MARPALANDPAEQQAAPRTVVKVSLTFEQCLYCVVFASALLLRLWHLGTVPLDATESHTALQSWWMANGTPSSPETFAGSQVLGASAQSSPFLIYLNALIFFALGAGDASARIVAALAGSALVVLPYFARRFIGHGAALVTAILLAFSPTLVFFSRYVGGAMVVAALSLGAALFFAHWARSRSLRPAEGRLPSQDSGQPLSQGNNLSLYLGLVLLALLLANGIAGYVNALLFLTFGAGWALSRSKACAELWRGVEAPKLMLVFATTLILALTGLLSNLHGIQAGTAAVLALHSTLASVNVPFSSYVQLLLAYEGLIVVFAFADLVFLSGRMNLFHWFLWWWAAASLVLYSALPDRSAAFVVQPLVPLAFLAADLIAYLLRWFSREKAAIPFAVLALTDGPALLVIAFVFSGFAFPSGNAPAAFALVPVVVLVLATVGSIYWRGSAYAARLWGMLALLLLSGLFLHTSTNLNIQAPSPSELLRSQTSTADVLNLASDVDQTLAGAVGLGLKGDVVVIGPNQDVLGWYLRKYDPKFSLANSKPLIVVGPANTQLPSGQWAMQRYAIGVSAVPEWTSMGNLWGWLIYRDSPNPPVYENVVVYVSI